MQLHESHIERFPDDFARVAGLFEEVRLLARRLSYAGNPNGDGFAAGALGVLRTLSEHGAQTAPQIGRLRGTSRQNIQILVNRLADEGLVEFVKNPAHKRSEFVRLTGLGKKTFEKEHGQEAAFVAGVASQLPEADVEAVSLVLQKIRSMMGEGGGQRAEGSGLRSEVRGQRAKDQSQGTDSVTQGAESRNQKSEVRRPKAKEESAAEKLPEPEADDSELPYNLL
jgi:DNA-binding MarR family transcriptional regulator